MLIIFLLIAVLGLYILKIILNSNLRGIIMFRKIIYWALSYTWGILMTLVGSIFSLVLLIKKFKPEKVKSTVIFRIGNSWGGVNFGPFCFVCKNASRETVLHEAGHSVQNIIWGPLFPFVIGVPSALRYWVRKFNQDERLRFTISICIMLICSIDFLLIVFALALKNVFIWIFLTTWSIYVVALCIWMCFKEIPRYRYGLTIYNSIWFEGQATELGYKYFQ